MEDWGASAAGRLAAGQQPCPEHGERVPEQKSPLIVPKTNPFLLEGLSSWAREQVPQGSRASGTWRSWCSDHSSFNHWEVSGGEDGNRGHTDQVADRNEKASG